MPGRLAIDFGTSNTVVAVWDEARQEGAPLHVPDYGRLSLRGDEQISVVPSLIHYTADRRRWIGDQVLQQELYQSDRTFRWMKRYIANRSPVKKRLDGRELSHFDAGRDFLSADPPGKQGEARFEVGFKIDDNKRLLVTARDIQTGRVTHRDYPVVKLT